MNHSPITSDSGGDYSDSDGDKEAALNSKPSSRIGSVHDVSISSGSSNGATSLHDASLSSTSSISRDNVSPLLPTPQLDPSSAAQKPAKRRNPLLTWTSEELHLVSLMRQGMMNTSRRKRSKKPKDAPKRPLR